MHEILQLTGEHLELVLVAILVAAGIGLPAGVLLARRARLRPFLLGFANVMQTIPSLALFNSRSRFRWSEASERGLRLWRWCCMPCFRYSAIRWLGF